MDPDARSSRYFTSSHTTPEAEAVNLGKVAGGAVAKRVVPVFYRLERIPVLRYLRLAFPVLVYRDMPESWSVLDTFDTYASHYESRHRPKEVFAWFREMGLVDLDLLDSDDGWVSVTGRKPIA